MQSKMCVSEERWERSRLLDRLGTGRVAQLRRRDGCARETADRWRPRGDDIDVEAVRGSDGRATGRGRVSVERAEEGEER